MADDQLEEWIIQGDLKKERRSRIVPSSTDRLASEDPGDGESAMEAVVAWMGAMLDLPVVEFAVLSPQTITLTFAEDVVLHEPWASPLEEPHHPSDQWGITHQDAFTLPRGEGYGWQAAGLTGLGTLSDGNRLLVSTCRWEILQIVGTEEWAHNLMITQVMSQAAEPWSAEHDIWLIGFGDTAEKLISFLSGEHPPHRFHIADSLTEVSALDLKGTTATLYVMGSSPETESQFQALQVSGIGMVTDLVITDKAMFLTERDGGAAVLGPFQRNLEIWPNLREDLVEKMEQAWQLNEELARQKAAAADFSQLLEAPEEAASSEGRTPEEIKEDFEDLMARSNVTADDFTISEGEGQSIDRTNSRAAVEEPQEAANIGEEAPEGEQPSNTAEEDSEPTGPPTQQAEGVSTSAEKDATVPASGSQNKNDDELNEVPSDAAQNTAEAAEQHDGAEDQDHSKKALEPTEDTSSASSTPEAATAPSAGKRSNRTAVILTALGDARADTPEGELTGRHAAALIILELTNEPMPAQQISEALWPGDETEGHTARTRRSRLLSKLRSYIGDIITIGDEGWTIEPGHLSTDYDQVLDVLTNEPIDRHETITEACQRITRPLDGAEIWADYYRSRMTDRLTAALTDLKTRAIEAEAFDVAKAAKAASTTLGED